MFGLRHEGQVKGWSFEDDDNLYTRENTRNRCLPKIKKDSFHIIFTHTNDIFKHFGTLPLTLRLKRKKKWHFLTLYLINWQ